MDKGKNPNKKGSDADRRENLHQHHFGKTHQRSAHEKLIVATASTKSFASIINEQSVKKIKEPGLRQQQQSNKKDPIVAAGKDLKQQRKRSSVNKSPRKSKGSIARPSLEPVPRESIVSGNSSEESISKRRIGSVTLSRENIGKEVLRKFSRDNSDSSTESIQHSDDWDLFGEYQTDEIESLEEQEALYEMAPVDIDIEAMQSEMNKFVLDRAFAQTRISDREKSLLADKFGILLQGLVTSQETEVEVIDQLRMKTSIINVLHKFIDGEQAVGGIAVPDEEAVAEEGSPGEILGAFESDSKPEDDKRISLSVDAPLLNLTNDNQDSLRTEDMSATSIRENLLSQKNKLEIQENMKFVHVLEIKQFEFEKLLLDIHYRKMTKPVEIQREMKDLRKAVNDLRLEVSGIHREITQLKNDIAKNEKQVNEIEGLVDNFDLEVMTKQQALQTSANKPLHLTKEADREANKLEQAQDVFETINKDFFDKLETMRSFQSKLDEKLSELNSLAREESRMQHYHKQAIQSLEIVQGELEKHIHREQVLAERIALCIDETQLSIRTKKKLVEDLHRVYNETSKSHREHLKLERTYLQATDAFLNSRLAYEKMKTVFEVSNRPSYSDAGTWERLISMFTREIAKVKEVLRIKIEDAEYHAKNVEMFQKKLNDLYEEQVSCGKHLQDLVRLSVRKRREREEKSDQCIKLDAQITKITFDRKILELVLSDCGREERELYRQKDVLKTIFQQVKIEKGGLANDVSALKQKVTEQNEKTKMCQNEMESLEHQLSDREHELARVHYLNLNAGLAVESVRNEALRVVDKFQFFLNERIELKLSNELIRKEIVLQNIEVDQARENFEKAVRKGNDTGFIIRDRIEEVTCILERNKTYERIILNATAELKLREMEKAKLQTVFEDSKTHLMYILSNQPDENRYIKKIDELRTQFKEVANQRRQLEIESNQVTDTDRVREINHSWIEEREKPEVLLPKLDNLEGQLATREMKVMERDLLLKQLDESIQTSLAQANHLKQSTEKSVKSLVGMRKSLSILSNKVDGMICEASLAIGKSDSCETEFLKLKRMVDKAESHFKSGLPPSKEMEEEWAHYEWQKKQLERSKNKRPRYLFVPNRPKGSQIIMERLRPKPKLPRSNSMTTFYHGQSEAIRKPQNPKPTACPTKPYKPKTTTLGRGPGPLAIANRNKNKSKLELAKVSMTKLMEKKFGANNNGAGLKLCGRT